MYKRGLKVVLDSELVHIVFGVRGKNSFTVRNGRGFGCLTEPYSCGWTVVCFVSVIFLDIFFILLTFYSVLSNFLLLFGYIIVFFSFFSFLTGVPSLLGPSLGFWHVALPVGVCSVECSNNCIENNNNNTIDNRLDSVMHHFHLKLVSFHPFEKSGAFSFSFS